VSDPPERPAWLSKLHPSLWPHALGRRRGENEPVTLTILLRFTGPPERLAALGLSISSMAGDVAVATLRRDALARVAEAAEILAIEPSRPMRLSP
jgi:hypothetical protein